MFVSRLISSKPQLELSLTLTVVCVRYERWPLFQVKAEVEVEEILNFRLRLRLRLRSISFMKGLGWNLRLHISSILYEMLIL